jgi:hypothetical protein
VLEEKCKRKYLSTGKRKQKNGENYRSSFIIFILHAVLA